MSKVIKLYNISVGVGGYVKYRYNFDARIRASKGSFMLSLTHQSETNGWVRMGVRWGEKRGESLLFLQEEAKRGSIRLHLELDSW